ncbi:MAG: hypothetical protein JSV65_19885 [Armatimonadota bacterium]|nr:MAG: hypothetical protein JSV65_19885 [Armatimonadota bacterium]
MTFCPALARAGDVDDQTYPLLTAAPLATPPAIDGVVADDEWPTASTTGVLMLRTGAVARYQPLFLIAYDAARLYVAGRLPLAAGVRPQVTVMERDGPVWQDDAVEIFLDPSHSHSDYYQFMVNSRGVVWDSHRKDASWDCDLRCAAYIADDEWTFELAIPWSDLGFPEPPRGRPLGFNLCWDRVTPTEQHGTWSPLKETFHEPQRFGHLILGTNVTPVRLVSLGPLWAGRWAVRGGVIGETKDGVVLTVDVRPAGTDAALYSKEQRLGAESLVVLDGEVPDADGSPTPGEYVFSYRFIAGSEVVARAVIPVDIPEYVSWKTYPVEGVVEVKCNAAVLTERALKPARFMVSLLRDGTTERAAEAPLDEASEDARTSLSIAGLPPGDYTLAVVAEDDDRKVVARHEAPFDMPPPAYWLGSSEGLAPDLPVGWPAVQAESSTVNVWGREYRFDGGPFLTSAVSQDAALLATAPIVARVRWSGGEGILTGPRAELVELSPARAVLRAQAAAGPFRTEADITVEFDGMIRTDFTVAAPAGTTIEHLALSIPLKAEYAKYLYHYPGRWGSAYNAGALPPEGWRHSFKPVVWLGDEERGFCWFAETDEHWFPLDNEQAIEIRREGDAVILRLNVIASPRRLDGALSYSFGFQATPVKEVTEDVWDFRICHHGRYGLESLPYAVPTPVTYPAQGNIRLDQGTAEMWVVPMFDPDPTVPQDVNRGAFNQDLFTVRLPDDALIGFYWNIDDRGMRFYLKDGTQYPVILGAPCAWKMGEPHHVAVTWGEEARIYADGRVLRTADYRGTVARDLKGAEIRLGADRSHFIVDEMRISDIARSEFDLTAPLAADDHTLLLDHFDDAFTPDGYLRTAPEKSAGEGGTVTVGAAFVPARFGRGVRLFQEPGRELTYLDRLAELGVRTIVFHEHWTDIQDYPATTHGEALHRLVKACHERGIRLLLYFGYEMSNIAPEYPYYSDECLVYPRAGGYTRQPEQTACIVCYGSHWQDFLVSGIARIMDEYGIDGVYLDGTANPFDCANLHHGCGYRGPDGSPRKTYRIFDVRRTMKRIYNVVKGRRPDGLVNVHQSTCMTIPTLAFATSYWDGEQFGAIESGIEVFDLLPLDAFRAEFMGHQWGVPAEFLCYNRPYTYPQAMAFTLLHDVLVRGSLGGSLEMESALWREMEDFGRRDAEWLPYWSNQDVARVQPATCKASIYNRGPLGAMLVISNLAQEEASARIALDTVALRLPERATARDVLSGEPLPWDDGALRASLGPLSFRVVHIAP